MMQIVAVSREFEARLRHAATGKLSLSTQQKMGTFFRKSGACTYTTFAILNDLVLKFPIYEPWYMYQSSNHRHYYLKPHNYPKTCLQQRLRAAIRDRARGCTYTALSQSGYLIIFSVYDQ